MPGFNETTDNTGRAAADVLLAATEPDFEAATVALCELFQGLGFAADRIFLLAGSHATVHGILDALAAAPDLGDADRMWFYHSGAAAGSPAARLKVRADSARRVLLLDRHGVLATALAKHLGGPDLPMTAGELASRLDGVARVCVPSGAAAMLLFPHLLTAPDVHRLRSAASGAPAFRAAAMWRELALLDPADADARLLRAHFEAVARHDERPF